MIGRDCTFLHGVTLGSTGKSGGKRHPTVGDDVLIGCNATVLGNIFIGNSVKVGSGSIVLKSVPARCSVVGNPARIVGTSSTKEKSAAGMDFALNDVIALNGEPYLGTFTLWADGKHIFDDAEVDRDGRLTLAQAKHEWRKKPHSVGEPVIDIDNLFHTLDVDQKGMVNCFELERSILSNYAAHAYAYEI